MSSYGAPPLPNRPYDASRSSPPPPPIPPLPKGYNPHEDQESMYNTQPHLSAPMLAPRPHKVTPDLPANMAATLDAQTQNNQYRGSSPMPTPGSQAYPRGTSPNPPPPPPPAFPMAYTPQPSFNNGSLAPSHSYSSSYGGSPAPSNNNDWSPWAIPAPSHTPLPAPGGMNTPPRSYATSPALPQPQLPASGPLPDIHAGGSLIASMDALTFSSAPQPRHPMPERHATTYSTYGPPQKTPSPPTGATPSLTAPLPTIASLYAGLTTIERAGPDAKIAWARDVLSLVERAQPPERVPGPARLEDPELARLATQHAVPIILSICASAQAPPHPKATAEAFYHRACLANTGDFPELVQPSARLAFRDFETSARAGYHPAWFKLGRDYETVQDSTHARDCFERGAKYNVESCLYRMGMAHLLGQLGLPARPETAVPLLHRAATLATVTVPQPAYVFGLLLIDQFAQVSIPAHLFAPIIPPGSDAPSEARRHLERAAYLNFAPAQYKLGHAYEFAMGPFPFDPLLSVQYYSLASQQGEPEADMSLSKWFLCGAENCFDKDEGLAYTFAEKAARRGLPSAEFAMGYYAEVGVGGPKDIDNARKWYQRATEHGNEDAKGRLAALSAPQAQALSRDEHENLTQATLVRKRTQAKQASDARRPQAQPVQQGQGQRPPMPRADAQEAVALARKSSKINHAGPGGSVGLAQGRRQPSAIPENVATGHGRRPSGQVPPDGHRVPSHSNSTPAGPGPQQQQQQQQQQYNPNAPRYNLSDRPASSGPAHPGPGRQQTAPASAQQGPGSRPGSSAGGRPQQGQVPPVPTPASSPPAQNKPPEMKYQTFAQMGIQGAKAEEKDCVIM